MVSSETPEPAGADQSLGDLVALAAKDVSQLIRYEIDLATTELKGDARRVGMAAGAVGLAAFVACLVLVLLSFGLAYGLIARGIWMWASFLIVSGLYILLAGDSARDRPDQGAQAVRPEQDAQDRDRRARDTAPERQAARRPAPRDHRVQDPVR